MHYFVVGLMLLIATVNLPAAYQLGDTVDDFTWQDTNLDQDGNTVSTQKNLYQLIESGKIVYLHFFFPTSPYSPAPAPMLEQLYNQYIADSTIYLVSVNIGVESATELNGATWRQKFTPNLTYPLSTKTELGAYWGTHSFYGPFGVPANFIIGKDYQLVATDINNKSPWDEAAMDLQISDAIAAMPRPVQILAPQPLNGAHAHPKMLKVFNNVANDRIILEFTTFKSTQIELALYNTQGTLVQKLHNGQLSAGKHQYELHTSRLTPGIYYANLNQGNSVLDHQLVLVH